MKPIWTLARREMAATFDSPIAYIAGVVFLVATGLLFFFGLGGSDDYFTAREATLRPLFDYAPWVLAVILPAVTMRLLAEEKKSGTLELLVTMPVTDLQIVLGKLLGAVGFLVVALLLTLIVEVPLVAWLFRGRAPSIVPLLRHFGLRMGDRRVAPAKS